MNSPEPNFDSEIKESISRTSSKESAKNKLYLNSTTEHLTKLNFRTSKVSAANNSKCTLKSALVMAAVGGFSKIWTNWFNKTKIINIEKLEACIKDNKPLITVANHSSCADDPLMWGMLSWDILVARPYLMRWTMAAKEICFTNRFTSKFFTLGRCIPTVRGEGVYQKAVDTCLDVLKNDGWVHVFPEGKVNLMKQSMRLKWGVGRLIHEMNFTPTVIPMWHMGMDDVLPNTKPRIPRLGKTLTVLIGDPICFEKILNDPEREKLSAAEIRIKIMAKIQQTLETLKIDAEHLHIKFINYNDNK
uniref:Tafazzin family protein n=1 Tax=Romanomermis culicivorax TaxID=13658 RepID=A0A915HSM9_ROMCU